MTDDEIDQRASAPVSGAAANELMGLFAPPPKPERKSLPPSMFVEPSERDPLVPNSGGNTESSSSNVKEDYLTATVRRTNESPTKIDLISMGDETLENGRFTDDASSKWSPRRDSIGTGREMFLKTAAASSAQLQKAGKSREESWPQGISSFSPCALLRSLLTPFLSPSTWLGGILFLLYHVGFCMANGGSITRPYSGGRTSLLGDMAQYTALGIIVACPYLVFTLSNRKNQVGIPAMYPSADLFLVPFIAQAAEVIDKTIMDDWKSGSLDDLDTHPRYSGEEELSPEDELFLTKLWFGSFAVVVSFGMFAGGSLLILASKIKLANLGNYLPYGVLCGFFSCVAIVMWKLAITIDTPDNHGEETNWIDRIRHHLPSLVMGILMNRLGPKHPFFVGGLILLTVLSFYVVMWISGVSLHEARNNGWFYSHEQLQSSYSIYSWNGNLVEDSDGFLSKDLPPKPLGTWDALIVQRVHWKAVFRGAEQMIALAVLYLLRCSIHAAALKKSVQTMVRRVPVREDDEEDEDDTKDVENKKFPYPLLPVGRQHTGASNASHTTMKWASQIAKSIRNEVRIVKMSLADRETLAGKRFSSPRIKHRRKVSTATTSTAVIKNLPQNIYNGNRIIDGKENSGIPVPTSPGFIPPVINGKREIDDDGSVLLPTGVQREISGLTRRTVSSDHSATYAEPLTPERKIPVGKGDGGGDGSNIENSEDYMEIHAPATDLTLEDIFAQYGYGMFVTGVLGGYGCLPTVATSNTMYAIGAGSPAPQYLAVFLLWLAFDCFGFELVRYIPKAAFSSLLVLSAADNTVTWFITPISKMGSLLEWSVVPFIAIFSLLVGFLKAVVLGIGLSTFIFVTDFFRVSVVKYDASGLEIRSRIERSLVHSVWLDTHGDSIRALVLQNYLFFGNATSVLEYIETMFEEIPLEESTRLAYPIPPVPVVLVLDLALTTGMDTSAVDVFMDILRICKANNCKLYICGLCPRLKKTFSRGGMKPETHGPKKSRTFLYFSDLDHGLGMAEEVCIDMKMGDFANQSLFRLEKGGSGFHIALQHIDQLHSTNMADGLLELEPHTKVVTLEAGQILYEKDGGVIKKNDHGLFFIESGMIREDDGRSDRTNTRTRGSFHGSSIFRKVNDGTLRGKHARLDTAARRAALAQLVGGEASQSNNLRIATNGPGWIVGINQFAMGQDSLKKLRAITNVKMHHLSFSDLAKIEKESPALILRLYKMLTRVMARKEEDTVGHLMTLHGILSARCESP